MMGTEEVKWAYQQAGLNITEKAVLACLAHHHNRDTGKCCPGMDLIAQELGTDRFTVGRIVRRLEEKGIIVVTKQWKKAHYILQPVDNSVDNLWISQVTQDHVTEDHVIEDHISRDSGSRDYTSNESNRKKIDLCALKKKRAPSVPYRKIRDSYSKHLYMCPQIELYPQLEKKMKARWFTDKDTQSVAWFDGLFQFIAEECPFLIGQKETARGPFFCNLDWIMTQRNFHKICGGVYKEQK